MISYLGENYPISYDEVGKYVCSYIVIPADITHISILDVLYQQFAQLVFPI